MQRPLAIALVLAAVAGAVLAGSTAPADTTLASSAYNRGWDVPSADAIAALDR